MTTFQSKTYGSSNSRAEWITEAACRDVDPEIFFAKRRVNDAEAKNICWTRCTVRELCLADAMATESRMSLSDTWGVLGGLDADQRLRRRRPAAGQTARQRRDARDDEMEAAA